VNDPRGTALAETAKHVSSHEFSTAVLFVESAKLYDPISRQAKKTRNLPGVSNSDG
jgi:hypothetical protein